MKNTTFHVLINSKSLDVIRKALDQAVFTKKADEVEGALLAEMITELLDNPNTGINDFTEGY